MFPSGPEPLDFYEAVVHATADTLPLVRELRPDVVVADILTLAPALAAELEGIPCATLIPHIYPHTEPHFPIYSIGARLPAHARSGAPSGGARTAPVEQGLELGRVELNDTRAQLGLPPLEHVHGGTSRQLALVATLPAARVPARLARARPRRRAAHVGAPGRGGRAAARRGAARAGRALHLPGPRHRLLRAALRGLADAPVRVLATWNRRLPSRPLPVPANARVVDWVSYSRTMPHCDVVVCHAGHGTLVRALASGCAVVACPAVGDMNENAARLDWAGAGVRVPRRFISPRPLRLAVEEALAKPSIRARAHGSLPVDHGAILTHDPPRTRGAARRVWVEAPGVGLEPTTLRLTAECSAN